MLSLHPHDFNSNPYYLPYRTLTGPSISAEHALVPMSMGGTQQLEVSQAEAGDNNSSSSGNNTEQEPPLSPLYHRPPLRDTTVAQALEIARESPDGARDPTISGILESALSQIWGRVLDHPDSYVMTPDEFAVFNFYQHRFTGNKVAISARSRYWDNTRA